MRMRATTELEQWRIERPAAEAIKVNRNKAKAQAFAEAANGVAHGWRTCPRDIVGRQLDACDGIVKPHAQLPKAELPQAVFELVDAAQPLHRNLRAMRKARRQTGQLRFIPRA